MTPSLALILWTTALATPLSLDDAIRRAAADNPALRAGAAAADGVAARRDEARSALLPRLDFGESVARTDQPVAVFGARLAQESLRPADLQIGTLEDPDARNDFVSRLDLQAPLVDVGRWYALRAAATHEDAARSAVRADEARVVAAVVRAYFGARLADARLEVAREAAAAVRADVARARSMRDTGVAKDADVLALETQRAALDEAVIVATGEVAVARAELARLLGSPLDTAFALTTPLDAPGGAGPAPAAGEPPEAAVAAPADAPAPHHPALAHADALVAAAEAQQAGARWSLAPVVVAQASLERHRAELTGDGATHGFVGVSLRLNLFGGLGDRARLDAAEAERSRAEALRDDTRAGVALAIRRARIALDQAAARRQVTGDAVALARESHRLERARFEAGMAHASDVLRTRAALLDAEARHLAALHAARVAVFDLAAARGELNRHWKETTR
jgi:outer membrane protein TolC